MWCGNISPPSPEGIEVEIAPCTSTLVPSVAAECPDGAYGDLSPSPFSMVLNMSDWNNDIYGKYYSSKFIE